MSFIAGIMNKIFTGPLDGRLPILEDPSGNAVNAQCDASGRQYVSVQAMADALLRLGVRNTTTPILTDEQTTMLPVDRRGLQQISATIAHNRRIRCVAAGAITNFGPLVEGATDGLAVSADAIVYAHCRERPRLAVNGDFDGSTNWTVGTAWVPDGNGAIQLVNGVTTALVQVTATANPNDPILVGSTYAVVFTVSNHFGGTITPYLGTQAGTARSANGTYVELITAATTGNLSFVPSAPFSGGKVSNVWVIAALPTIAAKDRAPYSVVRVAGVAAAALATTLVTTIAVQGLWYRYPGVTEIT